MGNIFRKVSKICDYCEESLSENNPYLYNIIGYGKHDGRVICNNCLIERFQRGNS